ncbi:hypothetical protein PARPLA_01816 [Rhodobacteraceae bacterium THAF1]|uniref:cobalamin biosynthesis protein CobQ n=1 Tax=Palleronia sp. THAF1 TaxID=2587842 RepID=UPI000F4086D8|nr:cobalamin biosynthesis protein CobQ [Palleronia sp. THAF1]QFU09049.1 hypothetical protein FIU81_10220 [Palleronia sp. THAF1]VDC24161.1 hypothetical protein PARPLA_01816 [Rhodobacteraceae bacterium THAF1]
MNTPAHLIMGAAAFGRPGQNTVIAAALAGGFAPDLSLYLMAGVALFVMSIPAEQVFGTLYYSDTWQTVFGIDNSFVLWGIGLAIAVWAGSRWAVAFTGAALLHLIFDFPLHSHDARMHFWPVTDWKFHSPISYWEGRSGEVWSLIETGLVVVMSVWLIWRDFSLPWRLTFGALAIAQLAPFLIWRLVF